MVQSLVDLLKSVFKPESDWQQFARKIIGILLSAGLGTLLWTLYLSPEVNLGEQTVAEILSTDSDKRERVKDLLNNLEDNNDRIKSVWLYSWPDARNLVPVMYAGDSVNPLPLGVFRNSDQFPVGSYVLEQCTPLDRRFPNHTCPISGFQDAWGILVVRYVDGYDVKDGEFSQEDLHRMESIADTISTILYSNDSHVDSFQRL